MSLELLPDELILYLFEFLNDIHIFHAFYGLNYRFDTLLFTSRPSHCLDFRSSSKRTFQIICEKLIPLIVDRITCIRFSNDDDTPQQIEHFLGHSMPLHLFVNLRSLSLSHLRSYATMEEIAEEWRHLPHLIHLYFTQCSMECNPDSGRSLVNCIWCLPKLIYCQFGVRFSHDTYFPNPTVISSSLEHLSVPYLHFRLSELCELMKYTPHIRRLCISINNNFDDRDLSFIIPSMISLKLRARDASYAIRKLLRCMPNLTRLTVKALETYAGSLTNFLHDRLNNDTTYCGSFLNSSLPIYMNGNKWEDIIINHLPQLKTFRLKMKTQYLSRDKKKNEIDKLLASFTSPFWIRERRWFVRCVWNPEPESCYVCLYTLPYTFDSFDICTASIQSKSTCYNNDYSFYDHVHNLRYHFSLSNSSALRRIRFSNIRRLSIELPFNDIVWSALSTFYHMNSLNVFIRNDDVKVQNQLQMLFDRAPNLYSLRISCGHLSSPELTLLKNSSVSVRHLDLSGYTKHKGWEWFNEQQCIALCNSPLGIQCEMLHVRVENPMDVLCLVYSMSRLRALNVHILNDAHNVQSFELSSTEDEVVQWLQHSLDSTCTVRRHDTDSHCIQLWLR